MQEDLHPQHLSQELKVLGVLGFVFFFLSLIVSSIHGSRQGVCELHILCQEGTLCFPSCHNQLRYQGRYLQLYGAEPAHPNLLVPR